MLKFSFSFMLCGSWLPCGKVQTQDIFMGVESSASQLSSRLFWIWGKNDWILNKYFTVHKKLNYSLNYETCFLDSVWCHLGSWLQICVWVLLILKHFKFSSGQPWDVHSRTYTPVWSLWMEVQNPEHVGWCYCSTSQEVPRSFLSSTVQPGAWLWNVSGENKTRRGWEQATRDG